MTDIVYWGNGTTTLGEYVAPKDVSTAAIAQLVGGQRLDWNLGSFTTQNPPINYSKSQGQPVKESQYRTRMRAGSWVGGWVTSRVRYVGSLSPGRFIPYGAQRAFTLLGFSRVSIGGFALGYWQIGNTFDYANTMEAVLWQGLDNTVTGIDFEILSTSVIGSFGSDWTLTVSDAVSSQTFTYSTEPTNFVFTNIPGGCAIAITYADQTTQQLTLGSCPEWVRVRDDRECPEGTCSVECDAHICCYGCSGQVVKIIPK